MRAGPGRRASRSARPRREPRWLGLRSTDPAPVLRAIDRNAVAFDGGQKPLLSIILIDIGTESGLQVGHELDLYRMRKPTQEADKQKQLILPDIDLGDAIVLEVRQGFAEALITRTTNLPLYRGDQVRTKVK